MSQIETQAPTKHLPPRKDVQKTDLVDDPAEELKRRRAELEPPVSTVSKSENGEPSGSFASASVGLMDRNQLTDQDILDLVDSAKQGMDPTLLRLDPSLALRSALDHALEAADRDHEEFSPFNLVDPHFYSRILATLAHEYGFEVEGEGVEPGEGVHLTGIDLIEDARERVSSLRSELTSRRRHLREQIANFDAYVERMQQAPSQSLLARTVGKQSLIEIDQQLDEELVKLDEYQRKLRDALKREIDRVFEADFGASPIVQITFNDVRPSEFVESENEWVLAFSVVLEEVFDPRVDRRLEVDDRGLIHGGDIDALLEEAGERIRRKLAIIRRCFERFLGGQTEVTTDNTLFGSPQDGRYRVFAKFGFKVVVRVAGGNSVRLITLAIADALNDLMNSEYGRLASRCRKSMADWYKEQ